MASAWSSIRSPSFSNALAAFATQDRYCPWLFQVPPDTGPAQGQSASVSIGLRSINRVSVTLNVAALGPKLLSLKRPRFVTSKALRGGKGLTGNATLVKTVPEVSCAPKVNPASGFGMPSKSTVPKPAGFEPAESSKKSPNVSFDINTNQSSPVNWCPATVTV